MITIEQAYQKGCSELAYLGDAVFGIYVREYLMNKYDYNAGVLNRMANKIVCASTQAVIYDEIVGIMNDDEADILRRGRNISPRNIAKSSTIEEYSKATSIEALLGYHYIYGNIERVRELIEMMIGGRI